MTKHVLFAFEVGTPINDSIKRLGEFDSHQSCLEYIWDNLMDKIQNVSPCRLKCAGLSEKDFTDNPNANGWFIPFKDDELKSIVCVELP